MFNTYFWLRHAFAISMLLPLAACNLSASVVTDEPTETVVASVPTFEATTTTAPASTATTQPTTAPQPTGGDVFRLIQPLPAAACSVVPNVDAVNIRSGQSTQQSVIGVLPANNWVSVSKLSPDGWFQIVALGTVVNGGWISSTVVNLQQPCACTPTSCISVNAPPPSSVPVIGVEGLQPSGAGACVVTAGAEDVPVYAQPQGLPGEVAVLKAKSGLPTFEYLEGRYAVNFSTETQQLVGWVDSWRTTVAGDCQYLQPPTVCSVQPSVGRVIDIYSEPRRNAPVNNALNEHYYVPFIQFSADGWFYVDMGAGNKGWIAPDEGLLVGPCDNGQ
ncbi:MAG: SH3 domain-containing protein [Anaerolineae bacterium]